MLIHSNPEILDGKPVVKGTRVPVELVLELVQAGYSMDEILKEYRHPKRDSLLDILHFPKPATEPI